MANHKIKGRKEATILRELTIIIEREMKNDILRALSIAEVRLTNDSEIAKIYWSFLPLNNEITKELISSELEENKKTIRMKLAHKLNTRTVPDLFFEYDTSLENANRIEEILNKVNK
ncbi:30S ribosome-binding factor RbfA [Mesoplasma tabanidae]|uniref:Ribosome-binding factor A n=1 Tax=Mesoplasma tabanidae TaxID=219745 RepID=A0A2K8P7M9_9MOLU|nr:30S ribosome-binding factor RbfA [Mesoplasma tabanidae]ATZ21615.1 ribosome-binding factor A [Mesoplasma tabanidae]